MTKIAKMIAAIVEPDTDIIAFDPLKIILLVERLGGISLDCKGGCFRRGILWKAAHCWRVNPNNHIGKFYDRRSGPHFQEGLDKLHE